MSQQPLESSGWSSSPKPPQHLTDVAVRHALAGVGLPHTPPDVLYRPPVRVDVRGQGFFDYLAPVPIKGVGQGIQSDCGFRPLRGILGYAIRCNTL